MVNEHGDGRIALCCEAAPGVQGALVASNPGRYYVPKYIGHHGWVCFDLDAGEIDWREIEDFVRESYRLVTPRKLSVSIEMIERRQMQKITPCLWFDDQAEEAATFYVSMFKNSKVLDVARYAEGGPRPAGTVLTVTFQLEGQEFLALNGGPEFTFSEAISFYVHCETQQEVDEFWEKLTGGGGQESVCGWLKDKYGLSWQIVPNALPELLNDPDPEKASRVMQAMMQMRKIDIAGLETAYKGQ